MAKQQPKYYSISQISCFRGCKQKWVYQYRDKLYPRAPQRPLYMGSTLHKLLEIRANGGSWQEYLNTEVKAEFDKMPQTYQSILGEDFIECCDKIMRQYDWTWGNENIKYLATEVKIEAKIKGMKRFVGVVDAICEIDGVQYIMEHKTFKTTKMSMEQTWLNQQTCLYIKRLNEMGYNIQGVIWDMLKTSAYKPPRVLKDGSFGKQYSDQTLMSFADIGCTDIPPAVYEDVKNNRLNFLDRYITPVQPSVVEAVWKDFVETVEEIAKNKGCAKNLGRDCDWCGYKDLCQTALTGGDVEYTKQLYYTTPLQREKELIEEFATTNPDCIHCQERIMTAGLKVDFSQCIEHCDKYKNFKEAKANG